MNYLKDILDSFFICLIIVSWLAGIVLATGWLKVAAIFPFYAWYLVVEHVMHMTKFI